MRKSHHLGRGGKRIALLLCMTLVWMSVTPASQVTVEGATLSQLKDKQNQLQQEKEENQEKLNELKESEEEQEEYVAALQDQIGNLQGQIDTLNAQVDLLNEEIREKEDAIADKQNQIDTDMNQLKKRLRALYMAGDASTLAILLHAENIEDLARKSEVIKSIARHDNELISSLKEELDAVADEKAAIEKDKKEVTQSKNSLDEQRKELADLEEEAKETLAEIQGKKNQVQNTLNSLEGEMADAENAIDQWYRDYYSSQNGSSNSGNSNQGSGSYSGSMTWPVPGYSGCIYQGFSSTHKGYDISGGGIYGAPIVAAASGRVIFAAFGTAYNSHNRYGYCVDIDHGSGIATRYAHCSALTVSAGDYVTAGQVIGYVGSTGQSTGAHLHFEVRKNGVAVNPAGYL
ncbi:MAG: peptidoglycan DD-metalloendopeptidase family protein [Clostridia bacterium]|nr:peptidoglycan DD-metalloendopeptidase family protein [Clostridia bacterium]